MSINEKRAGPGGDRPSRNVVSSTAERQEFTPVHDLPQASGATLDQIEARFAAALDDLRAYRAAGGGELAAPAAAAGPLLVNVAARRAGVSEATIRRWCSTHDIGRLNGGRWVVDGAKLAAFLEAPR